MADLVERLNERFEKHLADILIPSETVHIKLRGDTAEALVATDQRVMVLKAGGLWSGQLFGRSAFQEPYANLSSASVVLGLFNFGHLELTTPSMPHQKAAYIKRGDRPMASALPNCVSFVGKKNAARFQAAATWILQQIAAARMPATTHSAAVPTSAAIPEHTPVTRPATEHDAIITSLDRLAALFHEGVLTQAEFDEKKQVLLAKLV